MLLQQGGELLGFLQGREVVGFGHAGDQLQGQLGGDLNVPTGLEEAPGTGVGGLSGLPE